MNTTDEISIVPARADDVQLLLSLIGELAEYERLADQAVASAEDLSRSLFGSPPAAEALIARVSSEPAGFALYFHNFSTFLGRRGLYLEDLYVRPAHRGRGIGRALLVRLAQIAVERRCGRFEWAVLDWNRPARDFYETLGAGPNPEWINYRISGEALDRLAGRAP